MREVKRFEARGGRLFDMEAKCRQYDERLRLLAEAESLLVPRPKGFPSDGSGYVQQKPLSVAQAMCKVVGASPCLDDMKLDGFAEQPFRSRWGVIGRVLSDCDNAAYRVWFRFMCMDGEYREWGQPYFAHNPHEGKAVCLAGGAG